MAGTDWEFSTTSFWQTDALCNRLFASRFACCRSAVRFGGIWFASCCICRASWNSSLQLANDEAGTSPRKMAAKTIVNFQFYSAMQMSLWVGLEWLGLVAAGTCNLLFRAFAHLLQLRA